MVRVYRKDLGFGEGTDGQNYYEVSEERAKELAAVGYTTNPKEANPGTLRADFADSIDANAVHGSDSEQSAEREINYFFSD